MSRAQKTWLVCPTEPVKDVYFVLLGLGRVYNDETRAWFYQQFNRQSVSSLTVKSFEFFHNLCVWASKLVQIKRFLKIKQINELKFMFGL